MGECECGGAHVVVHLHLQVHCADRRVCEQTGGCVSRAPVRWAAQWRRTLERPVVDLVLQRLLLLVEGHPDLVRRRLVGRRRHLVRQLRLERPLRGERELVSVPARRATGHAQAYLGLDHQVAPCLRPAAVLRGRHRHRRARQVAHLDLRRAREGRESVATLDWPMEGSATHLRLDLRADDCARGATTGSAWAQYKWWQRCKEEGKALTRQDRLVERARDLDLRVRRG